jgi:hypothetical protein
MGRVDGDARLARLARIAVESGFGFVRKSVPPARPRYRIPKSSPRLRREASTCPDAVAAPRRERQICLIPGARIVTIDANRGFPRLVSGKMNWDYGELLMFSAHGA